MSLSTIYFRTLPVLLSAGMALTLPSPGSILLDINLQGGATASPADFSNAGVAGLSGSEEVGGVEINFVDDNRTSFTFSTGPTMDFDVRARGAFSKDLGNELLNDYIFLENGAGNGGPIAVSLGSLGLTPGTIYTLHLFGSEGSPDELSSFTPVNNSGINFASLTPSNGNLVVEFTTSPGYSGQSVEFTWARAAESPNFAVFNGIAIQAGAAPDPGSMGTVQWKCSTESNRWTDKADVALGEPIAFNDATSDRVLVNSDNTRQQIDGWGGCFNERGWKAMEALSPAARDALMNEMFNPTTGLKLGLCRTPIGSSDYAYLNDTIPYVSADHLYSLNETAGDYSMANFSIARDQARLIPYIKAAQAIRPDLEIWASPWSPPSWMKDNNSLVSGNIKADAQTLDALALYFARYVQAYAAEGIPISMVMPQNEPNISSNYSSCLWKGAQLARFVGYHLGPTFQAEGIGSAIYLGTINDDDDRGGYAYWVAPCLNDPNVSQYVDGLGCQWDSAPTMAETHLLKPELKLMQTETECNDPARFTTNVNDWTYAEYQFGLAMKWFNAGANSHMMWNMVLDETGQSTGGWAQNSPVVVDTTSGAVTYTPFFHLYKHFSFFVEPGAHLAATEGSWGDMLAFTNPDGSTVIVLANRTGDDLPVTLNINGNWTAPITIPARSFNTFTSDPVTPTPLSSLESWRDYYFGTTENAGPAANLADPDADGLNNELEFPLGLDPTASQPSPIEAQNVSGTFKFHYQRNKAAMADGVAFIVEWSNTLEAETWTNDAVTEEVTSEDPWLQQVTASIPASSDARFARLRVVL